MKTVQRLTAGLLIFCCMGAALAAGLSDYLDSVKGALDGNEGAAGGLGSMLPSSSTDLDGYITTKTLDGLFLMIAKEERKIRANPMAQGSELLQKVFGAYN